MSPGFGALRRLERTFGQFEQMEHAEIFQQVGNSRIRIQQFNPAIAAVIFPLPQLKTESGEHPEERAVHQQALGKLEHKIRVALLAQFVNESFEINTRIE